MARRLPLTVSTGAALLIAFALGGGALAQMTPRPDSRIASYPTEPALIPPRAIRFEPAWERELSGETIVRIAGSAGTIVTLTASGRLTAWDAATGDPKGSLEGFDPSSPLAAACGVVLARHSDGTLRLLRGAELTAAPDQVPGSVPLGAFHGEAASPGGCGAWLAAAASGSLALLPVAGSAEARPTPGLALEPPVAAGGRLWILARGSEGADPQLVALAPPGATPPHRLPRPRTVSGATTLGSRGPGARRFALAGSAWLESRDGRSGRARWHAATLTGAGSPPLVIETAPSPGWHGRPETLVVVGTLDGDIVARREDNGHLAWVARAAGRITRPLAVWVAPPAGVDPDRTRLLAASVGSRRLEAFRAVDGAPAGALQLGAESGIILAGPILVEAGGQVRCVIAWSPFAKAGSRLLSLRLV